MKTLWQNKNFFGTAGRRCRIRTALQAPKASVLPLHHILYKNVLWSGGGGVSPMPRPQISTAIPYFSFILAPQESAKPIDIIIVKKALTRRLSRRHFLMSVTQWHSLQDSNLDKWFWRPLCYHYIKAIYEAKNSISYITNPMRCSPEAHIYRISYPVCSVSYSDVSSLASPQGFEPQTLRLEI